MKFKFVTYVSTAAVLSGLLMATQPASAITGLADNKSSALEVLPDNHYRWKLQTAADEDWFLWKNKTADEHDVSASFTSPSGKNYDFEVQYVTPEKTIVIKAEDHGQGGTDSIHLTSIKPEESVYMRLKSHDGDYSTTSNYDFTYSIK
ncbi:hypothetical protein [Bacillus inaquosorum]|uniref:Uncharacterized protein n=1 Tax=Bacillus inaquosorum KCTC 13429 TaxID=1236548 RepID=A0A9W5PEK3_9BACI|nr:hypothetical protein [Bacillus inaquosorum]PPA35421.1 hypothetical protein C4E21_11090 [Bacillus subtilis]AMA54014.1 hypothetical protein AN935_17690 [Bacillus inaquosorum]AWM18612.1 hypothetical protein DKG76_18595 [Bacillus inaquosorum]ELS62776.1 hypothetical protein BSI_01670 [Bacillus inaquosorum KCTC 13429]MBT2193151.1 hypothetical protein [Bacillus inaquosorum]